MDALGFDGTDARIWEMRRENLLVTFGQIAQKLFAARLGHGAITVKAHRPVGSDERNDRAMSGIPDAENAIVAVDYLIAHVAGCMALDCDGGDAGGNHRTGLKGLHLSGDRLYERRKIPLALHEDTLGARHANLPLGEGRGAVCGGQTPHMIPVDMSD